MRVRSLVLALVAASLGSPKGSEPQAVVTRVYRGNDFGHYYSDPPYWRAAAERFLAKALGGANHPTPRVINTRQACRLPAGDCATQRRRCSGGELSTTDRCSTSITSWNRITGPSSAGSAPVNISGLSGALGAQLPVTKQFI
jgi:hypothetical protein